MVKILQICYYRRKKVILLTLSILVHHITAGLREYGDSFLHFRDAVPMKGPRCYELKGASGSMEHESEVVESVEGERLEDIEMEESLWEQSPLKPW